MRIHHSLCFTLCLIVMSCVPIPVKEVRGPSGPTKSRDYSFIKEGETTRREVINKLGWMEIDIMEPGLFWGRWSDSGVVWIGGGPQVGGGAIRPWNTHNLFVEFDAREIVTSSRIIEESRINSELLSLWKRSGKRLLSRNSIMSIDVSLYMSDGSGRATEGTLRWTGNAFELWAGLTRILMADILHMQCLPKGTENPAFLMQTIGYREGLKMPKSILISMPASNLLKLLKYVATSDGFIPVPSLRAPVPIAPADKTVFSIYPRRTTLRWRPTPGAYAYIVQWEYSSRRRWSSEGRDFPDYTNLITRTSYTFDFVGAQPGRWRIWPVNADGLRGTPSKWQTFRYTR
jgi:hypothetical protein